MQHIRSVQSILQQGGDRHRPDTAGNRRDVGGALGGGLKIHIASQFAVLHAIDAHVDDRGARLYPLPLDQPWLADGYDEDVRPAGVNRWQMVVVAPLSSSSMLMGRPTMLDAPTMTAC